MSQIRRKDLVWLFFGRNYMDLLKDDLKKLYFRFLIPSFGSAMVISGILWIGYGVGMPVLLRVM